ncbi:unnamed protein product [Auanema sp. JU1783]|nr:unnamed protein product [Auanema sp. JU1783]
MLWILIVSLPIALAAHFPDPPVFAAVPSYPSICYLPPDSGLCDTKEKPELLVRYYFDSISQKCYPFGVQGCGGNENRFKDMQSCDKYCQLETK